jgi:hypothetical protein
MAVIGGALAYLLCDFGEWPKLMYDVYEREWLVASKPPAASVMVYPGMILWGLCGATTSAALCVALAQRSKRELSASFLQLVAGWALSAVGLTALYFLWGLWPF